MKSIHLHLSPRQTWLACLGALAVLTLAIFQLLLMPAWDAWRARQDVLESRREEYSRLMDNMSISKETSRQMARLAADVWQADSEESTVSNFLRDLETKWRQANLRLSSMRPLPLKKTRTLRLYPVRLAVSGNLGDVARFLSDLATGPGVTGLESFSIRGTQGSDAVECQMSIWTVRLVGRGAKGKIAGSGPAATSESATQPASRATNEER